ncbi:MAG: hypothetical protein IJ364_08790 [Oscillospiraceae bacterium]|nr:hypothetical protein [Oscillospiraceae bacterium]
MFGYLSADISRLSEGELKRYKACYCGLCRCIKEQQGNLARLTLNYDMTFLILLLSSLYEPEERAGELRCMVHPAKPRAWISSEITAYAADMNLALAYHKCKDDWADDRSIGAAAVAKLFESKYNEISKVYPRQCSAMEKMMAQLREAEQSGSAGADYNASLFGELMAEIFLWRDDRWSETLKAMAFSLGQFIYIMDACMDLEADHLHGRYNPFMEYHGREDNEQRFRDILKMLLGQCLYYFDKLPLVQDAGILKNVLCAGLWAQFDKKYSNKKEPSDE